MFEIESLGHPEVADRLRAVGREEAVPRVIHAGAPGQGATRQS